MGQEDLPEIIIYINQVTKFKKVALVAHHEGTTQAFYSLSKHPNFFNERVSIFVALAPATKLTNTKSDLMKLLTKQMQMIAEAEVLLDTREIFGPNW